VSPKKTVYHALSTATPGILALFDPDRVPEKNIERITSCVCEEGVAGILVGSSLLVSPKLDSFVATVKKYSDKPVILFPGGSHQVSPHADAIFFLSLLSGRNPEFLIGEQVKAVFLVKEYGLEVIPVGYILIESGSRTAVEYISNTKPIPRNKVDIAVAHALAGEYLGMKYIYLEAGSGASQPVPISMVKRVKRAITLPLIVGGGVNTKKGAQQLIDAGADFIVLGSIIERSYVQFKKLMESLK
jgi:phosphoglycerol geranylgeranyltransferase